jgi:prolyl-tRNA synthetase
MRQSQLFTRSRREAPKDEESRNAQLLIRAGYVHKEMAGVYAYMPLGLRVIEKIKGIVREEMNALGCQEFIMTSLQRKELWEKTDRWDDRNVDVWFKSELKNGGQVGFGWSHEEPITDMMRNYISSYRDLPVYGYQFQTKLRNELRAKSGIMRGREFVMKDLYSYSRTEEEHKAFYDGVIAAYLRVFERVGLGNSTFLTFASGGAFTQFSHEFQTVSDVGEDIIYLDRNKKIAINQEVLTDEVVAQLGVDRGTLEEVKAVEVGNIFSFGGTKCEQLGLFFKDDDGSQKPVILGSYGIGITRLMGIVVEHFSDDKGLVWPEAIAPFKVHLLSLGADEAATKVYETLVAAGIEVLYDDRDARAGEKFADSDLLGLPYRVVIGKRSVESGEAEVKQRTNEENEMVAIADLVKYFVDR